MKPKLILCLSLVFFIMATNLARGGDAGRSLTLKFSVDHTNKSFSAGMAINFDVVLHALNVEDANQFEAPVIDDWRYDTPNYFTDRRSPNIVLHIERFENKNARWEAIAFRASSQSGGGSEVGVDVFVGGDESIQYKEALRSLIESAKAKRIAETDLKKQVRELRALYGPNKPGRYRITATYTGLRQGSGRVLLTTGAVEVTVNAPEP